MKDELEDRKNASELPIRSGFPTVLSDLSVIESNSEGKQERTDRNVGKSIIGMVSDWVYFIFEHIVVALNNGHLQRDAECHLRRFFTCRSIPGR